MGASTCGKAPSFDGPIWLGDTKRLALVRCISPEDPDLPCEEWDLMTPDQARFDDVMAVRIVDMVQYRQDILDSCEKWK